jgi:hypothetical protein
MSWLFSQALVEEYLEENSLDGEQSVQLNGNPIQQAYCAPDKMTGFSRLSRFGITFKLLTENRGEELLTLYLEDFHAKTSVPQEKEQELTENEAECGEKWRASFTKYDHNTHSWKTHQCSLLEDLELFSETWPQWGLMRNGECWEQRTLEQTIRGTESGLLEKIPTPQARDWKGSSGRSMKGLEYDLPTHAKKWPTPDANCGTRGTELEWSPKRESGQKAQFSLNQAIKMWPTPQASDNRDRGNMSNPSIQRRVAIGKQIMLSQSVDPTSGQLNPTWVEWLMGWPLGWTDLKPLETDKCHFALQPHGES